MKLKDKVAIVTGAGSGIGKEIALLYAKEGAKVVVSDINEKNAQAVTDEIQANQGTAYTVRADIGQLADIDQLIDSTVDVFGTVDILVNNAGIMDSFEAVAEVTDEKWDQIITVNTTSVMRSMRKVIPIFLEKQSGVIINVASIGGLYGTRAGAAYTASKHAVIGMTKNTGYMYATKGIRCNAIAPGGVETNIGESIGHINEFGMGRIQLGMGSNPRNGKPQEIATVALFLASDDSSFVNGTVITADSGWNGY